MLFVPVPSAGLSPSFCLSWGAKKPVYRYYACVIMLATWKKINNLTAFPGRKGRAMLIGAHESISGGLERSVERAEEDGCEAMQIFSGSPSKWSMLPVPSDAAGKFRESLAESQVRSILVHGSYLVNPASPDRELWKKSLDAMKAEYSRCRQIAADYLVVHPGSHRGDGLEDGIRRAADLFTRVLEGAGDGPVILLENTAGAGSTLGGSFTELGRIRGLIPFPARIGFCLDTAHAFAGGYDMGTGEGVKKALAGIDDEAGTGPIMAFHINDSARALGSGIDRHARIGEGLMGMDGFKTLLGLVEFRGCPAILETQPLPVPRGRYKDQVDILKGLRMESGRK